MWWSLSSIINVAMLKHPAVGSTFCPQMHVCGFHALMGTVCAQLMTESGSVYTYYTYVSLYIRWSKEKNKSIFLNDNIHQLPISFLYQMFSFSVESQDLLCSSLLQETCGTFGEYFNQSNGTDPGFCPKLQLNHSLNCLEMSKVKRERKRRG